MEGLSPLEGLVPVLLDEEIEALRNALRNQLSCDVDVLFGYPRKEITFEELSRGCESLPGSREVFEQNLALAFQVPLLELQRIVPDYNSCAAEPERARQLLEENFPLLLTKKCEGFRSKIRPSISYRLIFDLNNGKVASNIFVEHNWEVIGTICLLVDLPAYDHLFQKAILLRDDELKIWKTGSFLPNSEMFENNFDEILIALVSFLPQEELETMKIMRATYNFYAAYPEDSEKPCLPSYAS